MSSEKSALAQDTRAVHGAWEGADGHRAKKLGDAVPTPIVSSSTFAFASTAELREHFEGRGHEDEYGRYGSPSVRSAEGALAALDGAEACALFASGMAAITTTILALVRSGDHVVLTSDCYRRTRQFVGDMLARLGVTSTLVEPGDVAALEAAIVPGATRVVLTESPSNPYLRVADVEAIAAVKRAHRGVKLLVDATFATPVNATPLALGADLVLHSATKYLGGHNDLLAGAVGGSASLVSLVRDMRGMLGGVLDPHAAYLLERGMKTLSLRVARQNETALAVARFLEGHRAVERVFYPMLPTHPDHLVARRALRGGGGVVTFAIRGDLDATSRFVDALRIATIAPSLGGVETLVEQPALMSYYELASEERARLGIPENLVRYSVGIEDAKDLLLDLERALGGLS